jgi:broad specificity phosphatase PhoE
VRRRELLLAGVSLGVVRGARADQDSAWAALAGGGIAILLRHAQTVPGVGDPSGFRIGDCSTQRNLSAEGRRQAERIGAALAARGVRVDAVLSSQWCRCLDTARLAFPRHAIEPFAALNSFFDDRTAAPAQTREALARIATVRAPSNVAFVTHQVNIVALTGEALGSGEAVLARHDGAGLRTVGRLAL